MQHCFICKVEEHRFLANIPLKDIDRLQKNFTDYIKTLIERERRVLPDIQRARNSANKSAFFYKMADKLESLKEM